MCLADGRSEIPSAVDPNELYGRSWYWIAGLVPVILTLIVSAGVGQASSNEQGDLRDPDTPKYEHLFNCLCQMTVENGEVDASQNCGKPLANCSCGFSEKMRKTLRALDERGLGREQQIQALQEEYGQFGNKVLAVPDPGNSNWFLAYLVPPVVVVLALLFIGGIGWYWIEDRVRTDLDPESGEKPFPEDDEISDQLEREIEEYKNS